jgi:hypothetical protein
MEYIKTLLNKTNLLLPGNEAHSLHVRSATFAATHSKSRKGDLPQRTFSLNVRKLNDIGQQAESIVPFQSIEHNPHVLLRTQQLKAPREHVMRNHNAGAL